MKQHIENLKPTLEAAMVARLLFKSGLSNSPNSEKYHRGYKITEKRLAKIICIESPSPRNGLEPKYVRVVVVVVVVVERTD